MSIGMILLVVLALLILFGVLQRVLDRMALSDREAIACVAAIFIGGWLPDLSFGMITLNIGGAIIPLIVCVYLILNADTGKEKIRAVVASALTAAAITALSLFFPSDPTQMPFDPLILYGVAGGLIAWILGRSRRSAFIAGVLGVMLADLFAGLSVWIRGIPQPIHLGGAGALDAIVLSGVIAVLMCELTGEMMERIKTGKAQSPREDGGIAGGHRA